MKDHTEKRNNQIVDPTRLPQAKIFIDHSSRILNTICAKAKVKRPTLLVRELTTRWSPGQWQRSFHKTKPWFPNIQIHRFQPESERHKRHWAALWHGCFGLWLPSWGFLPLSRAESTHPLSPTALLKKGCYSIIDLCFLNYKRISTCFKLFSCLILTRVFHVLKLLPFHGQRTIIIIPEKINCIRCLWRLTV